MGINGKPDEPYKNKDGKQYTRTRFAEKLYNEALEEKLPLRAALDVYPFTDKNGKAAIILQQAGIVSPLTDGSFGGKQTITNAQAAAWMARLDWLQIDPLSPYGWTLSDEGASMHYIYTGKLSTGSKKLGGKAYTFNDLGMLQDK